MPGEGHMPESVYDEPPGRGGAADGADSPAAVAESVGGAAGGGERSPAAPTDGESVAEVLRGSLRRNVKAVISVGVALALLALAGQALIFGAKRCEFSLDAVREDGDPPGLNPTVRLTGQNSKCSRQGCTGRIEVLAPPPGDPQACPIWGTVCGHEYWENDEPANVVCRALGYTSGSLYNCARNRPP
eukprot:COSAG04_NODE_6310_length_1358_cov_1.444003_1_plen_187_part_00